MEFHRLNEDHVAAVASMFELLDGPYFRPHAFTPDAARWVCQQRGRDGFYGGFSGSAMLAYGLLRGWDAGFSDPSLGIAVRPDVRGCGHGKAMMAFLHQEAEHAGAKRIRLRVHPENLSARSMYERIGYRFDGTMDRGQYVGWYELA